MGERFIYDRIQGCVVPLSEYERPEPQRSFFPAPMISTDSMAPVQSMLDGKMYDSKSAIRATYKQAGMVEVGNDPARHRPHVKPKPDRSAIKATVEKATARFERGERVTKTA